MQTRIKTGDWRDLGELAQRVRHQVFVIEQQIPAELEWDDMDELCFHVIVTNSEGQAIGTGRLLPNGYIGRMAVLQEYRKQKIGERILQALVEKARQRGHAVASLNAQQSAIAFYEKNGFQTDGELFSEANIPHQLMVKFL